jgi:hypothetical protein
MSSENPTATETPKGNKPVHEIPDGLLKVAIWKHDGEHGPRYSATCRRRYKDGEEWKDTQSYFEDDMLRLSKMWDQADTWIREQKRADAQARKKQADTVAA